MQIFYKSFLFSSNQLWVRSINFVINRATWKKNGALKPCILAWNTKLTHKSIQNERINAAWPIIKTTANWIKKKIPNETWLFGAKVKFYKYKTTVCSECDFDEICMLFVAVCFFLFVWIIKRCDGNKEMLLFCIYVKIEMRAEKKTSLKNKRHGFFFCISDKPSIFGSFNCGSCYIHFGWAIWSVCYCLWTQNKNHHSGICITFIGW